MNTIFKLEPFISTKIWGYEKWVVSTYPEGESLALPGKEPLGKVVGGRFPVLVKIIRAEETLSVQVHPDDEYARIHENDSGKTECWYILDAKPSASLVCGLRGSPTRAELKKIIEENSLERHLQEIPVHPGDMIYIPSGTVHAIKGGITLLEVQQSSNVTYRLYDWGRGREIHVEKSLDVIDYEGKNPGRKIVDFRKLETPFFSVEKLRLADVAPLKAFSCHTAYTVISGSGVFTDNAGARIEVAELDTVFAMPGAAVSTEGKMEVMRIVPPMEI